MKTSFYINVPLISSVFFVILLNSVAVFGQTTIQAKQTKTIQQSSFEAKIVKK